MSCFPEMTYAIYVDGELPAEQRRPLEAHLVGCRRCRELVVTLREEVDLVSAALHELAPAPRTATARPAPARALTATMSTGSSIVASSRSGSTRASARS